MSSVLPPVRLPTSAAMSPLWAWLASKLLSASVMPAPNWLVSMSPGVSIASTSNDMPPPPSPKAFSVPPPPNISLTVSPRLFPPRTFVKSRPDCPPVTFDSASPNPLARPPMALPVLSVALLRSDAAAKDVMAISVSSTTPFSASIDSV